MNPALDTALTIVGFVLAAAVVLFLVPWGIYGSFAATGAEPPVQPPRSRFHSAIGVGSVVVPPILLVGAWVTTLLLSLFATGWTFFYPPVGLAAGLAAWYGAILGLSSWYSSLQRAQLAAYTRKDAPSLSADQAISLLRDYLRQHEISYPTTDLVADRFQLGWSVHVPICNAASGPQALPGSPEARAVFLVGDSGRIEQASPSTPLGIAQNRFTARESLWSPLRGRWVRRR